MAIVNSYSRVGAFAPFFAARQASYERHPAFVAFWAHQYYAYNRNYFTASLDSTNTIQPRLSTYIQRPGGNRGDTTGVVFNTNGGPITLVSLEYSQVGPNGPWLATSLKPSDPLFFFPTHGNPVGEPFNLVFDIGDNYTGDIWLKITISSVLGTALDADGPFSFVYVNPLPPTPPSITVPSTSISGTYYVEWGVSSGATSYELEEATQPDFSDAQVIYSGPDLRFLVEDRSVGTYYYRVRAENPYGFSDWLVAFNGAVIPLPSMPSAITVPSLSKTGTFSLAWAAVDGAEGYELQEDIDPAFGNPKTIYNGPNRSFEVKKSERGTYYYRVRAWRT